MSIHLLKESPHPVGTNHYPIHFTMVMKLFKVDFEDFRDFFLTSKTGTINIIPEH